MLVDKMEYMTSGVYIGMKSCTPYMKQFVYKIREDGLSMLNLKRVDDRMKVVGNFLSGFDRIMIVSRKDTATKAVKVFSEVVGGRGVTGRFHPGTLTNPSYKDFYEPDIVLVIDPAVDEQAVKESKNKGIPIIAMCNTFNSVSNVDLVVPCNNNGKKSIAMALWLIAREIQKTRGKIKKYDDFKLTLKDFGDE